ncbi:MAG: fused MFS/spermidine synthase [Pseudomonadota bacterium]|nr:fused MFS/spermidine synthase [Pseudomonadota bacterium]
MPLLPVVFFLSGATSLVYESVWGRELHLVFGTSQFAIATVLAAFMTGLATGGYIGGRLSDRVRRPLRVYGILEAAVGLYALGFPTVVRALEPIYLSFWHATSPSPLAFGAFQFVLLGAGLLLPTACMGATLPLLVRHVAPAPGEAGRSVGRLYGINTGGAVVGVCLAGFWLLPDLGVRDTTLLVACGNFLLCGLAFWMDRSTAPLEPLPAATASPIPVPVLVVAALAGISSLAMEVAWFRLLTLILGASTYAFSVMLLAFLAGIALGGHVGGPFADRAKNARGAFLGLAGLQVGVALLSYAAMWMYGLLPIAFVKAFFIIDGVPELLWPMKCLLAFLVMAPPAVLMGATFPFLVRAVLAVHAGDAARPVGGVYAANTVGAIVGAFGGGFVLLPTLYVTGTVLFCSTLNLLGAAVAISAAGERRRLAWGGALAAGIVAMAWTFPPPWSPMLMSSGVYKYVDNLEEPTFAEIKKRFLDRYELLYYKEGLSTVITVAHNKTTGNVWLANNGKIDASTTSDMPTQVLVAHTAFLFTGERAKNAALIGLASGITLGAMTLHPELENIDVIELEPAMAEATEFFRAWNHAALDDERVNVLANDGRNQLLLTPPGTYDIIVAEPSNPWLTGVSNLFTREFFEMGKARLAPGGIWSQWVQMYGMDARDLQSIMRTFATVYPHVLVFSTIEDADLVMIGSDSPLDFDLAKARALATKNPAVTAELHAVGVDDGYDLLCHALFDRDMVLWRTNGIPLNTDDNLLVEYSAPKNLHTETSTDNFRMLRKWMAKPAIEQARRLETVEDLEELALAYSDREDLVRAMVALQEAERRDPARAATAALMDDVRRRWNETAR